jgi:hypothetical protein
MVYNFDLLDIENFEITKIDEKQFYNLDFNISLQEWIESVTPKIKEKETFPNLSSCLKIKNTSDRKMSVTSLGWFSCGTNTVQRNNIDVGIFSVPYGHKGTSGFEIHGVNFLKVSSAFASRCMIPVRWYNEKDVYTAPNERDELYKKYEVDSIVVTLFSNNSNQSGLRQVSYKDRLWDIKNEFFWMSKNEILELSNQNNYSDLYNDARTDSDRYVYNLLFGEERIYDKLSPDAKIVLDKASDLVRKSMQMREMFANDENHLKSWDAGYAQLRILWREYYAEDFKEFRELYKKLEDRMRPLVYELGFLMK